MDYVFFLGSHETLSAVEVLAVLRKRGLRFTVAERTDFYLVISLQDELPGNLLLQMGGCDRIAKIIDRRNTPWDVEDVLPFLDNLPSETKTVLGLSGLGVPRSFLKQLGPQLKKQLRERNGIRIKFIEAKGRDGRLNAAQVLFNKLTERPNRELFFIVHDEGRYFLAETLQVQDIQAYEARDTGRPARDAKVGMLPPKLAQILLNLARTDYPGEAAPPRIFDPFCGMGTLLQEGWLMGYDMVGSDSSSRMVDYAQKNLVALQQSTVFSDRLAELQLPQVLEHDARKAFPADIGPIDAIVTEPYLGEPLTSPLPDDLLEDRIRKLSTLYLAMLKGAYSLFRNEGWMVLILPAHAKRTPHQRRENDFTLFPSTFIDDARKLGYSLREVVPKELTHFYESTRRGTLIYSRLDALVGRELTLWHIRKQEDQQI